MQTSEQVAGEAREKLDEVVDLIVKAMPFVETSFGTPLRCLTNATPRELAEQITAALRAQPERGAEEMREPSPGLLMSMAMRYDHGLGMPGYYDQEIFQLAGSPAHILRLESALITMRQLWEEVTGNGFYKLSAEADYAARLAKLRALPLHPAKDDGGGR